MTTSALPSALLLGSSVRVIVTIARCLKSHGVPVHVASLLPEQPVIRSRAIESFRFLPAEPKAFAEAVAELVRTHRIEYVYPCGDEALAAIIGAEADLRPLVRIGCPAGEVVKRVLDKSLTMAAAAAAGIPLPGAYALDRVEAIRATPIRYPVVAKPRSKETAARFRIKYFPSAAALEAAFAEDPGFGANSLIQEYIPGGGVGIETLLHDGEPVVLFQHRRLTELPIDGGVSVRAVAEPVDPTLAAHAMALLRRLGWKGVAMVEFRHDPKSGRLALMEVNGRYWGSLPVSQAAGLEFPWYEWQLAHGQPATPPPAYDHVTVRWLSGEIQRLPQIAGEVLRRRFGLWPAMKELLALPVGFFTPLRDAVWRSDDTEPAWDDLRECWHSALRPVLDRVRFALLPFLRRRAQARARFGSLSAGALFEDLRSGRRAPAPARPLSARRLLILCHGNIMRSPFAAHLLGKRASGGAIAVESAGLGCIPGRPADDRAIRAARKVGIDLGRHRARPASEALIQGADAILVMDYRNLAMLLDRWPAAAAKTFLFRAWSEAADGAIEVPDPYGGSDEEVERCFALLQEAADKIPVAAPAGG